jgi:hypothetical protein
METIQIKPQDLKPGMVLKTWFGSHTLKRIDPYNGPFDFVYGVAVFVGIPSQMSLETNGRVEVYI